MLASGVGQKSMAAGRAVATEASEQSERIAVVYFMINYLLMSVSDWKRMRLSVKKRKSSGKKEKIKTSFFLHGRCYFNNARRNESGPNVRLLGDEVVTLIRLPHVGLLVILPYPILKYRYFQVRENGSGRL